MAYRSPVVGYFDPMRDVAGATLTVSPAAAAGQPESRLSDELARLLFAYGSAGAFSNVILDRGASDTTPLDWFFVPPGHDFAGGGGTYTWHASANGSSWGSAIASGSLPTETTSPLSAIASTPSTLRYQRVQFTNSFAWELGEARWSERVELSPTIGPVPAFRDYRAPVEVRTPLFAGVDQAVVEIAAPLRRTSITFEAQSGTELAGHRALLEALRWGQGRTVVLEGPDDEYPAYLARMAAAVVPAQDHPHPASGLAAPAYTVAYAFREVGA